MKIREIRFQDLKPQKFIDERVKEISAVVGNGIAINALSGGVDSSTVTMLGQRALGKRLKTYFIDHGLMREGEPEKIVSLFNRLGVKVMLVSAKKIFFSRLKGLSDPEQKRGAITQAFYQDVFAPLVKKSGARYLLHGTNYTDIEETVAGVKRQHNILDQLGIDTKKQYGYKVLEPLLQLRKSAVRKVARAIGLPAEIYNRMPFPGPALATRIIGKVTKERIDIIRVVTRIVEDELKDTKAFQYLAILHEDKVTGVKEGKRDYRYQIEIRCWDSEDAVTASVTRLPYKILERLADHITGKVKGVVSVTYNITKKPPSTIEAV